MSCIVLFLYSFFVRCCFYIRADSVIGLSNVELNTQIQVNKDMN
jgi:glutaredoxin 2